MKQYLKGPDQCLERTLWLLCGLNWGQDLRQKTEWQGSFGRLTKYRANSSGSVRWLQECPSGCPKAPQPLSLFRMSLDTFAVSVFTSGVGRPRTGKQERGQKGRKGTKKNLQNQGGSPQAGPQGLCNSLSVGFDPPPSSPPLPAAAGPGQPRVTVTGTVQWPRDLWLLPPNSRPTMFQLGDFLRNLSLTCELLLRDQPKTFPFSRVLVS